MSREVHVRFCESRGVRFPPATRLDKSDTSMSVDSFETQHVVEFGLERRDQCRPHSLVIDWLDAVADVPAAQRLDRCGGHAAGTGTRSGIRR